jgi:hypothetical protein
MEKRVFAIFVASVGLCCAVHCQRAAANNWVQFGDQAPDCVSFDATVDSTPKVAVVDPAQGQLHFIANAAQADACPSLEASCQRPGYLVGGDTVVVTSSTAEIACVHFVSREGRMTSGLVPAAALNVKGMTDATLNGADELGTWKTPGATITFRPGNEDFILVEGDASLGPPGYHTGSIAGPVYLSDNDTLGGYSEARYAGDRPPADVKADDEPGCLVRLRLLDREFLVVDDNDRCGGQGVSFNGLYRKAK